MIKRKKLILVSVLALIAALCLVAGCKLNASLDELIDRYEMTARVTYFLNDGQFEDKTRVKEMYYKPGSKPFDISIERPSSGSAQLENKHGAVFTGWYEVKTGENGNPLYADGTEYVDGSAFDSSKGIQMTEKTFDFNKPLEDGDHYYVCGDWLEVPKLIINLSLEDCTDLTDSSGTTYKEGDTISETYITGQVSFPGRNLIGTNDYSFISYYYDSECKNPVVWPLPQPEDDNDVTIYAKYIKGRWTIVENASGVASMFASGSENYYLLNDIDCTSVTVSRRSASSGKIRGNNHKISNLTVNGGQLTQTTTGSKGSLLGNIRASAEISDITFENVKLSFTSKTNAGVTPYFVCSSIEKGASLHNVTVGGQLTVELGENSVMLNKDNWLFGGVDSDDAYKEINVLSGTTGTITYYDGTTEALYL